MRTRLTVAIILMGWHQTRLGYFTQGNHLVTIKVVPSKSGMGRHMDLKSVDNGRRVSKSGSGKGEV